ncbi:MAG: hypothetical protein M3O35_13550 [Acidobacteriota bacterium]|nr:hypothetical protein [Acidobacteriota bacterium]
MIAKVALVTALLSVAFIQAQDSPRVTQANAPDAAANLVKIHNAWGPRASTPNTSLAIKEASRSGNVIKFRLYATGLPKGGNYTIVSWPVTQKGPSENLRGVSLDESGLAICAGSSTTTCGSAEKPDDPIDMVTQPVPGEPVRLGLIASDGSVKVFAKLVPVPLRGEDRGCVVEGVLLTPGSELVLIEGSGFPAGSEVILDSDSAGERHSPKVKADSEGRYESAILPYTQGVKSGTLRVDLKSARCSPSVQIPWGRRK